MGSKDLLGNWFNETGIVVTSSGDYGYYDENLNLVSSRTIGQYYFTVEDDSGNIIAELWDFYEDDFSEEPTNRVINICNRDNVKWINRDIAAFENIPISADEYSDITFTDSNIEAILGDFINPQNISDLEYISPQIKNNQTNYWITFFDNCGNIYNPFSNDGKGKVAKDLEDLIFYIPNFGNVQKVFSGRMTKDGIAFDVSSFSP